MEMLTQDLKLGLRAEACPGESAESVDEHEPVHTSRNSRANRTIDGLSWTGRNTSESDDTANSLGGSPTVQ